MVEDSRDKVAGQKAPSVPPLLPESFNCPHCGKSHAFFMAKCPENGQPVDRVYKMQGQLLEGKYRVGRMLAQGGMGIVYEATHTRIGRKLAVKFLMGTAMASREILARFQNEARIAASIGHRNIVDILDMGTTPAGNPYIVMEYLEGRDLGTVLDAVIRLPQPLAVEICIQILGALRAVHEREIVHRDLKPENVFVVSEPDGAVVVKLVDFGISRLAPARKQNLSLTRTGAVFGTPRYMAPEQARGHRSVDHRADLYSVGVILYELLTGAIPFAATDYNNMIIAITTEDPLRVSQHGVLIDEALASLVMKAISRDPQDRFQSADELLQALIPFRVQSMEGIDVSALLAAPLSGQMESGAGFVRAGSGAAPGLHHTPVHDNPTVIPDTGTSHPSIQSWEGSTRSVPPAARGGRSPLRTVLVVTTIPLLVLVAGGLMALIVLRFLDLSGGRAVSPSVQASPAPEAVSGDPEPQAPIAPSLFKVDLVGLPDLAEVQVDGALHPERPLLVAASATPRHVSVTAEGFERWEKDVAIRADVTMTVTLVPLDVEEPSSIEPTAPAPKTKKGGKGEKKTKIDVVYPGLR